jgi:hypothetical protein
MMWMTISPTTDFLAEILSGGGIPLSGAPIPPGQLAYFQERFKTRIFNILIDEFERQCELDPSLTKATIARRIRRRPEQITRWLSGPNNLELETVSDLFLGICGGEPSIAATPLIRPTEEQTLDERQSAAASALMIEPDASAALLIKANVLGGAAGYLLDHPAIGITQDYWRLVASMNLGRAPLPANDYMPPAIQRGVIAGGDANVE